MPPGKYEESKHDRDHGKFAPKGQGHPGEGKKPGAAPNKPVASADAYQGSQKPGRELKGQELEKAKAKYGTGAAPGGMASAGGGPNPHEHVHKNATLGHFAASDALEAIEGGNLAKGHVHGRSMQLALQQMKTMGANDKDLAAARQHLVKYSHGLKTEDHIMAHEAATGLSHEFFKIKHKMQGAMEAQSGMSGGPVPGQTSRDISIGKNAAPGDEPTPGYQETEEGLANQAEDDGSQGPDPDVMAEAEADDDVAAWKAGGRKGPDPRVMREAEADDGKPVAPDAPAGSKEWTWDENEKKTAKDFGRKEELHKNPYRQAPNKPVPVGDKSGGTPAGGGANSPGDEKIPKPPADHAAPEGMNPDHHAALIDHGFKHRGADLAGKGTHAYESDTHFAYYYPDGRTEIGKRGSRNDPTSKAHYLPGTKDTNAIRAHLQKVRGGKK